MLLSHERPPAVESDDGVDHERVVSVEQIEKLEIKEPSALAAARTIGEARVEPCEGRPSRRVAVLDIAEVLRVDERAEAIPRRNELRDISVAIEIASILIRGYPVPMAGVRGKPDATRPVSESSNERVRRTRPTRLPAWARS